MGEEREGEGKEKGRRRTPLGTPTPGCMALLLLRVLQSSKVE